jgi:hypothetical protein
MNIKINIYIFNKLLRDHLLRMHHPLLRKYKVTTVMFHYRFLAFRAKRYILV